MGHNFVTEILIFLLLLIGCQAKKKNLEVFNDRSVIQVNVETFHDSEPYVKQMSISPLSSVTVNVTNISSNVAFYIVQIHTYLHPVTLSYDKNYRSKVFGTNIGLYLKYNLNETSQLFLKNNEGYSVNAMLVIMSYNDKAPIPGGCNLEFDTEIAPYAKVLVENSTVIVDVQPASVPLSTGALSTVTPAPICDKNPVTHDMYQIFLPEQDLSNETYFSYISSMLTVQDIMTNGRQIAAVDVFNPLRRVFNAYAGTGSIYVTVATYGNNSAAYIPAFSYGCNPAEFPSSCQFLNDWYSKFICVCCFFVGFGSVFLGHNWIIVDVTVPVFFTAAIIFYVITAESITLAWTLGLAIAVTFGILQGCIVFNFFVPLSLGFIVACITYTHFPGALIFTHSSWVFWLMFTTVIIIVSLIKKLLYYITRGNATCAIFGSFMLILPFDYYAGSALKYIIINFIRRCNVPGFTYAIVEPPVQGKDIALIVFWILLAFWRFARPLCPGSVPLPLGESTPLIGQSTSTPRWKGRRPSRVRGKH